MFLKSISKEKKDYIAQVAAKVFSEKSYQVASLQDVSREVGLSKAGIYHYFQSKDEILGYLMLSYSDRFLEILQDCVGENSRNGLDPHDSLKELMRVYARYINSDQSQRSLILRERHQLSDPYQEMLLDKEREMFHLLKDEILKVQDFDKSIDPNVIAFLFIAMSHWLGYWVREDGKFTLSDIIEQNIDIIFKGSISNGQE